MSLLFDVGANRGDATLAGLNKGYRVIALEPAPRIFAELASNFTYNLNVTPLRLAASDTDNEFLEFYECVEDGLSTLNKDWLTKDGMPYAGKEFRTIQVPTIKLDTLIGKYGLPDLVKVDVEGAETQVFKGLTMKPIELCFEWSDVTLDEHVDQLQRLKRVNKYTEYALQYITHHLEKPLEYRPLSKAKDLRFWIEETKDAWITNEWKAAGLRPTADVGMLWVR